MVESLRGGLVALEWAILGYFTFANAFYGLLLLLASLELRRHLRSIRGESRWRVLGSAAAPRITVLAAAYDEAATIRESLSALLALYYPNLEIIVVNDGSRDPTLETMLEAFELVPILPIYQHQIRTEEVVGLYRSALYPNLLVIDKLNGGKADALNAGLNLASGTLVCALDSDTLIEPDALQRMVRPFLENSDVLAAGGTIRVANDSSVRRGRVVRAGVPRRVLAGIQTVEYLRAFLFGRLGWNRLGGSLIIAGAFGLFRRDALVAARGYTRDSVGEDMEMVLRLRRRAMEHGKVHRVDFIPDPVAWTQVPETLRVLGLQRDRWHRGLADGLWRHRRMMLNPRYGTVGLVAFPYFVFVELLAPLVEALGLLAVIVAALLGAVDLLFAGLFFLLAYGLVLVFSTAAILMDEVSFARERTFADRSRLLGWALLEHLGYRQLTVIWRLRGLWGFLRSSQAWGEMERTAFTPANVPEGDARP